MGLVGERTLDVEDVSELVQEQVAGVTTAVRPIAGTTRANTRAFPFDMRGQRPSRVGAFKRRILRLRGDRAGESRVGAKLS